VNRRNPSFDVAIPAARIVGAGTGILPAACRNADAPLVVDPSDPFGWEARK
jgi:hypothetical protein